MISTFLISNIYTAMVSIFFLKFAIYLIISEVRLHFQCYKLWVVGLNLLVWRTAITHHWWSWSTMQSTFLSTQLFNFLQPFHIASIYKINWILLISLQLLAKTFVSNIIIDISYNLSKYTQSEVFQNFFFFYQGKWVVYLHQHTVLAL